MISATNSRFSLRFKDTKRVWIPREYVWAVSTYLPYCYSSSRDYFRSCKSRASRVSDWTAFDNDDAWTKRSYQQPPCHLSLWGGETNLQRASRYLSDVSGRLKRQQQCCRFPIQVRTPRLKSGNDWMTWAPPCCAFNSEALLNLQRSHSVRFFLAQPTFGRRK